MSPTITSGRYPASSSASAPPSTAISTGLKSRMYGRTIRRSRLCPGPASDDERVPVAEPRPQRRKVDPLREEPALLAQVAHRVVGERLQRLGHPALLLGEHGRGSSASSARPVATHVPLR